MGAYLKIQNHMGIHLILCKWGPISRSERSSVRTRFVVQMGAYLLMMLKYLSCREISPHLHNPSPILFFPLQPKIFILFSRSTYIYGLCKWGPISNSRFVWDFT